ncbi:MAG TPA: hypothetical protein VJH88_03010 [Candidatus Nanoarchaeia archaeon]|nr:hypothetical protein [Candidatus Nanoarchaeia archaeon]
MALLLEESVRAEGLWRPIARTEHPVFADIPVERVDPDPKRKRHWMFATDNQKILAHVYKPDDVIHRYESAVVPLFGPKKRIPELTSRFIQDTITYLFFHELFHPVYCPKSKPDEEKFDVALKKGIARAEPYLTPRDVVNKAGNSRNAMWDLFIDTFFAEYAQSGQMYGRHLERALKTLPPIAGHHLTSLPDGVVTMWDVAELVDHDPETLFYPLTREMYALLQCESGQLRTSVFQYFREKMGKRIADDDIRKAVVGSLQGVVKYLDSKDLQRIGIDRSQVIDAANTVYDLRSKPEGTEAKHVLVHAITEIGIRTEFRYQSLEGIIEPLSKYIDINKEERRDGANTENQEGQGDGQTSSSQSGGGAEQVLQSLVNQGDPNAEEFITSIANDNSAPQNARNRRLSNLAKDEYYKRHAKEIPIKSPRKEAVTVEVGKRRVPQLVRTQLLTPQELSFVDLGRIIEFQTLTGIQCLTQISPFQYRLDHYEWNELPIRDFEYKTSGIEVPDTIIFRVDGSGSMTPSSAFVGTGNRYDALMHSVYGITKSAVSAATAVKKKVHVIGVSFSEPGKTRISEPVELVQFYNTPNNPAKQVLLNPDCGGTWHDLQAYEGAHRLATGKTLDIFVTDGDLDTPHDPSMDELRQILQKKDAAVAYLTIFQEGKFAERVKFLAERTKKITYRHFPNMNGLQQAGTDLVVQYDRVHERFGK